MAVLTITHIAGGYPNPWPGILVLLTSIAAVPVHLRPALLPQRRWDWKFRRMRRRFLWQKPTHALPTAGVERQLLPG
jgi:hypothetical protein